jgi:hypothetical protein
VKIRTCFVSNSSSSSFVCCISGETAACDHGGQWEDFAPIECSYGHGFAPQYALKKLPKNPTLEQKRDIISGEWIEAIISNACDSLKINPEDFDSLDAESVEKIYKEAEKDIRSKFETDDDDRYAYYDVPSCMCPVCSFKLISRDDRVSFMLKELLGDDKANCKRMDKLIKDKFNSYEEFAKYIKGIQP